MRFPESVHLQALLLLLILTGCRTTGEQSAPSRTPQPAATATEQATAPPATATAGPVATHSLPPTPVNAATAFPGDRDEALIPLPGIVFENGEGTWLVEAGSGERLLTAHTGVEISPDGTQGLICVDGDTVETFAPGDYGLPAGVEVARMGSPAWSPDGKLLAWMLGLRGSGYGEGEIWDGVLGVFNLEARTVTLIHPFRPAGRCGWLHPAVWSTDGRWLTFYSLHELMAEEFPVALQKVPRLVGNAFVKAVTRCNEKAAIVLEGSAWQVGADNVFGLMEAARDLTFDPAEIPCPTLCLVGVTESKVFQRQARHTYEVLDVPRPSSSFSERVSGCAAFFSPSPSSRFSVAYSLLRYPPSQ